LKGGEDDVVKLILDKGADVNMGAGPSGFTPLMGAVEVGRPELVKLLVERGADVNASKDGVTALRLAKMSQQRWNTKIEMIEILKKAGAKK
jgi:ankyrin repeat protein